MTDQLIETEGKIIEIISSTSFKVEINDGKTVSAHISGSMRMKLLGANAKPLSIGDKVIVQISPYDQTTARIVQRVN